MKSVLWLLVITSLIFITPLSAQENIQAEFKGELEKIRAIMDKGRWSSATKKLKSLLEEHGDKDYVHANWLTVDSYMADCAFGEFYETPDYDDLITGKLLSYKQSSGAIKMKYTDDTMGDFLGASTQRQNFYIHPAIFCGSYTVEVKGKKYPDMSSGLKPTINVFHLDGSTYSVLFGKKAEVDDSSPMSGGYRWNHWIPPRIIYSDGSNSKIIEEKSATQVKSGKPFSLKVKVSPTQIKAYTDNKSLISSKKTKSDKSRFGFSSTPFTEVLVSGKVEPAWLEGRLDEDMQMARVEFDKDYQSDRHLPEWLTLEVKDAATELTDAIMDFPAHTDPAQAVHLEKACKFLEREEYLEGLEYVTGLKEDQITPEMDSFLSMVFLNVLNRFEDALKQCVKVRECVPGCYIAKVMKAQLLLALQRNSDAELEFQKLIDLHPDKAHGYLGLVKIHLVAGRMEKARSVLEEGLSNRIRSKELNEIGRVVIHAMNGPRWKKVYEHESKHYRIYSDIDLQLCREAAQILEEAYTGYTVYLERIKNLEKEKFPVYLFSGKAGYMSYLGNIGMASSENSLGCYVPVLKQLMIWNTPERDMMLRTVRHEGFHQYLDRLSDHPPIWFNEGLAEYYEITEKKGNRWDWGVIHPDHLNTLKSSRFEPIPLQEFLYNDPATFMKDANTHYAQSWAFIHFLRHSTKQNKTLFERIFKIIQEGHASKHAVDIAFKNVDLDALEKAFLVNVEKLKQSG